MANHPCKILIADRNRHVREFLRRELTAEGYHVKVARDGLELMNCIDGDDKPHLLILDLEIPYLDEQKLWEHLGGCQPPLPVVVHTFLPEFPTRLAVPQAAAFLEKEGDPQLLKSIVAEVIGRVYPHRFRSRTRARKPKKQAEVT